MNNQDKVQKDTIPHSRPTLGPEEAGAVCAVIESGYIAAGKRVHKFEKAFADFLDLDYAISTSSGTSALHLTLLAMEIGPGDEVIIPSYVCTALLNAVNYTGATPILAEINPATFNLDAADVKRRINNRTKAIIVPHLFGLPADLKPLHELDVPIIEDCAQAVGSTYQRRPVGTFGQAAIFSFYATKLITTGEGGMVVTRSRSIAERVRDLMTYDRREKYNVRFNYKMTDIQAALGLVQLERLESIIRQRKSIAEKYRSGFDSFDLNLPPADTGHIYFRYVIGLNIDSITWIQTLARLGITCDRPIYFPLHRYFKMPGFPLTEKAWRQSVSIPIYPTLTDEQVNRVIDAVTICHQKFCKSH
jgi:dTDP-4-amino-4,6-dideoxygalactose transaminase